MGGTGSSESDIWIRPEAYERREQRRDQGDNEDDSTIGKMVCTSFHIGLPITHMNIDDLVCEFYVSTVAISDVP